MLISSYLFETQAYYLTGFYIKVSAKIRAALNNHQDSFKRYVITRVCSNFLNGESRLSSITSKTTYLSTCYWFLGQLRHFTIIDNLVYSMKVQIEFDLDNKQLTKLSYNRNKRTQNCNNTIE